MSANSQQARAPLFGAGPAEEPPGLPAPDETILRMRQEILAGAHWFEALLDAIGRWRLPAETVHGREFRYLIGAEAFDWLLLAERLLLEVADVVPPAQREALLFHGRWPLDMPEDEFERRIGAAKHSAHLNFQYGVLVEQALQLSVEEEIQKESRARAWGRDRRDDESMYERVYGKSREDLGAQYFEETGCLLSARVAYADWLDFTYWLFRLRMRRQDKARVASDTRKGLARLTLMEVEVSERHRGGRLDEVGFQQQYGD